MAMKVRPDFEPNTVFDCTQIAVDRQGRIWNIVVGPDYVTMEPYDVDADDDDPGQEAPFKGYTERAQ